MAIKHAAIIPLIGGELIASERAFGTKPEYILTYSAFAANETHLLNYYENQIPYHVIDKLGEDFRPTQVDVVSAVCPCAGLSSLSPSSSADSAVNDWMEISAKYVFENVKPRVFWGENAPAFATNKGTKIREKIRDLGQKHGYSMTVIKTKSLVHGLPQIRQRSFYFFWKDETAPVLEYYKRDHIKIEELIRNVKSNFQREPIGQGKPSDNKYLKYILEHLTKKTFAEFYAEMDRTIGVIDYIERHSNWVDTAEWMEANGYEREAKSCRRRQAKLDAGMGYMKKDLVIPKDYIGAFVGHLPSSIAHPDEDRFIDFREAMTIMGLPDDFELLNPKRQTNHICQNVPVGTATDMATEVREYLAGNRKSSGYKYVLQDNVNQKIEETSFLNKSLVDFIA
jgi:site-specific DNA-cytosine methylase